MRHSKLNLNASSAATWTVCTAQPHYVQQNASRIPPQDTEFSVEGTHGHKVVECLFKKEKLPNYATPEMIKHAEAFVKYGRERQGSAPQWWSEVKLDLFYMPGRNAYMDFGCLAADGLHVMDYKYGQGVAVNAFENLQGAIYARSAIKQLKLTKQQVPNIHIHIFQPRVRQGDKTSCWSLGWEELMQFTDDRILGPAEDIQAKALTLEFRPGTKTCQFCPAESFCEARIKWMLGDTPLEVILEDKEPVLQKPSAMSESLLAKLILKAGDIKKWLGSLEKYGLALALNNTPLPGLKLVKSKGGHRTWGNPDEAREKLLEHVRKEDIITEELLTPKQVEEFEHDFSKEEWAAIQKLIVKPEGGPTLVSIDDPRPVYGSEKLGDVFQDESGAEDFC